MRERISLAEFARRIQDGINEHNGGLVIGVGTKMSTEIYSVVYCVDNDGKEFSIEIPMFK